MGDTGPPTEDAPTDRRDVLRSIATATAAGGLGAILADRNVARPVEPSPTADSGDTADDGRDGDSVFPQSVASGGPTDSGVILWTRIAPEAVRADTPLTVEVADSEAFENIVYSGAVPAEAITPDHDHTVKVDLDGELDSDRFYHYRFRYDGATSQLGRCRTLPASDDDPEEISFGVLACQDYQNGYYGAYHHLAESDVDYLLHLGDFIYESADGNFLGPNDTVPDGREFELPSGASLAETLADFRALYKTYRSDPLLQSGLARHTLVAGWDDHEIGNNRYWDYAADAPVLPAKADGDDDEFALELTANGIQAWVEYMPARVEYDPSTTDLHEQFTLYRTLEFGDLVDLVVTDERLFRDGPPCPNGDSLSCGSEDATDRTMLGERQRAWWKEQVSTSEATWTAWLNAVLTMPLTLGEDWYQVEFLQDSWDGYQAERYELLQHLADTGAENFVTLTGDLHASLAGYMQSHYGDLDSGDRERVGVELMTPAVSSLTADSVVDFSTPVDDGLNDLATTTNDHLQYMDWYRNGYAVVTFGEEECRYTAYEVDTETDSTDADRSKLVEFRIPDGDIELQQEYNAFEEEAGSGWTDGLGEEVGEEVGEGVGEEIAEEVEEELGDGWDDWL